MKTIQYAIHEDGHVVSRMGTQCLWPVLDFAGIGMGGKGDDGIEYAPGNFNGPTRYLLEKFDVSGIHEWAKLHWTKKLPTPLKNTHRVAWGMKLLPVPVTPTHVLLSSEGKRRTKLLMYCGARVVLDEWGLSRPADFACCPPAKRQQATCAACKKAWRRAGQSVNYLPMGAG